MIHTYILNVGSDQSPMYHAFYKNDTKSDTKHTVAKTRDFDAAVKALDAVEKKRNTK